MILRLLDGFLRALSAQNQTRAAVALQRGAAARIKISAIPAKAGIHALKRLIGLNGPALGVDPGLRRGGYLSNVS